MKIKYKISAKLIKRIVIVLLSIILATIIALFIYAIITYNKLSDLEFIPSEDALYNEILADITPSPMPVITPKPTKIKTSKKSTPTVITSPTTQPPIPVINILVIGCDSKKPGSFSNARSDVNMVLTIDRENDEIKLTSFMRDIKVYYDHLSDYQRLNAALQYFDHPLGVVDIIEANFDVEIDYYMMTDYWGMADLIDIFKGVRIAISDAEISVLNDILATQNRLKGDYIRKDFVPHTPGTLRLTGRQAVAFMRIRKIGSDKARVKRQYDVLNELKSEISDMDFIELNKIIHQLPDILVTDMSEKEIIMISEILYSMKDNEFQQARVPFEGYYITTRYKGMSIIEIDFEENNRIMKEFMYE